MPADAPAALLPENLEDVDARWVESALRQFRPTPAGGVPITVRGVSIEDVTQCFATNARVRIDYAEPDGELPEVLFLKGGFRREDDLGPLFAAAYAREVRYYREIAGLVQLVQPRCYFAAADDRGRTILLLEDVVTTRGARFGSAPTPMSPEDVGAALGQLARLHAAQWDAGTKSSALTGLESYPGPLRPVVEALLGGANWQRALSRPAAELLPAALRDPATVLAATRAAWADNARGPHCLIHGDVHPGNLFRTPDGQLGFVDWQATSWGSWAYDVTRLIVTALAPAQRRQHERRLLTGYLAQLAAGGVTAPDPAAAWTSYRRNVVHGLRWLCSPSGSYSEDYVAAYVTRAVAAIEDLDALSAVG